jgi:hypothetical protein
VDLSVSPADAPRLIQTCRETLASFNIDIFIEYLRSAASLDEMPYAFETTCSIVHQFGVLPVASVQRALKDTFIAIIQKHETLLSRHSGDIHHIDIIVDTLLPLIEESPSLDVPFAEWLTVYISIRGWTREVLSRALGRCNPTFIGSVLTKYLAYGPGTRTEDTLYAMLVLCLGSSPTGVLAAFDEETLTAISAAPQLPLSQSVTAVIKTQILVASRDLPPHQLDALLDRLHVPTSSLEAGTSFGTPERWKHGVFAILVELVEQHSSTSTLDEWNQRNTANAFKSVTEYYPRDCEPPPLLQCRFATCVLGMIDSPTMSSHKQIIDAIINWGLSGSSPPLLFDDPTAREKISEALAVYARTLTNADSNLMGTINRFRALLNPSGGPPRRDCPHLRSIGGYYHPDHLRVYFRC